jgi:hypothetical protein
VLYPSREVRDAVFKSGMEHGAAESYDKFAEWELALVLRHKRKQIKVE